MWAFVGLLCGCEGSDLSSVLPKMVLIPAPGTLLQFEMVEVGRAPGPLQVRVRNEGGGRLELSSVRIEGSSRFSVAEQPPSTIDPGQEGRILIALELDGEGPAQAELVVEGNDPELPSARLPIDARSSERCVPVAMPGALTVGLREPQRFEVINEGLADCTLVEIEELEERFVVTPPPTLPLRIPARGRVELQVSQISLAQPAEPPTHELGLNMEDGARTSVMLTGEARGPCLRMLNEVAGFGLIAIGETVQRSVTVVNSCEWPYQIASARWIDDDPSGFGLVSELPVAVEPFAFAEIEVSFSPTARVIEQAGLRFSTTDALSVSLDVQLEGRGGRPEPFLFPRQLDFGNVIFQNPTGPQMRSECGGRGQIVHVHNIGDLPLRIDPGAIAGDGLFAVSSAVLNGEPQDPQMPLEIPDGVAAELSISFHPTRAGGHQAQLRLPTNAGDLTVDLQGFGVDGGVATDRFTQPVGPRSTSCG